MSTRLGHGESTRVRPSQKAKLDEAMAAAAEATGNSHPLLSGYQ